MRPVISALNHIQRVLILLFIVWWLCNDYVVILFVAIVNWYYILTYSMEHSPS